MNDNRYPTLCFDLGPGICQCRQIYRDNPIYMVWSGRLLNYIYVKMKIQTTCWSVYICTANDHRYPD